MELACPSCRKTLNVSESFSGQRLNCPGCGENVRVPVADGEHVDDLEIVEEDSADTRICPMCGATVKAIARKCRYCGEDLPAAVGPDSRPGHGIWRDGNQLVMTKEAQLPFVCIKTNQPADGWLRRKLYWHNPWIYALILVSIWIYAIVALIVRQKADIQVGLCRERIVRRRWTIAGAWFAVFLGAALIVIGGVTAQDNDLIWLLIIAGLVTILTGAIVGATIARIVAPTRITKQYVWLKGIHPGFLASLPAFPG